MLLTRPDDEIAGLKAGLRRSAKDHWVDVGDRLIRNGSHLEPSVLRIVDAEVYDHRYRSVTGDRYFRRELCLSQATWDRVRALLETRFGKNGPRQTARAALEIDGITDRTIACERPCSGPVTRKRLDVSRFYLAPDAGDVDDGERRPVFLEETAV